MPFDKDDLAQVNSDINWLHLHPSKVPEPIAQIGSRYARLRDAHLAASEVLVPLTAENSKLHASNEQLRAENRVLRDKLELPPEGPLVTDLSGADELAHELTGTTPAAARSSEVRPDQQEADEQPAAAPKKKGWLHS
jgi:hypothetical protein